MGPDCLNHFDAAGYFIQNTILLFDFFFFFLKICAVMGWVRKPLPLEPHPQFHPAHECFICLLFWRKGGHVCPAQPSPALLGLLPPQQPLELPQQLHSRLTKDLISSLFFYRKYTNVEKKHKVVFMTQLWEREQTFLMNWVTSLVHIWSDMWSPECRLGTIRVFLERNWKLLIDAREGSQDVVHLSR